MSNSDNKPDITDDISYKVLRRSSLFRDPKIRLNLTRANTRDGSIPYDRTLKKEKILQNPSIKTMGRVSDKTTAIDYKGLADLIIHPASYFDPETGGIKIIVQNVGDAPADGWRDVYVDFSHVTFDKTDSEDSIIQNASAGDKYDLLIDGEIKSLYVKKDRDLGLNKMTHDADGNFIYDKNNAYYLNYFYDYPIVIARNGGHRNQLAMASLQSGEWHTYPLYTGSFEPGEYYLVHVDDPIYYRRRGEPFLNTGDNVEKIDNDDVPSNNYFLFKYENRKPIPDIFQRNVSKGWTMNSYVDHPADVPP